MRIEHNTEGGAVEAPPQEALTVGEFLDLLRKNNPGQEVRVIGYKLPEADGYVKVDNAIATVDQAIVDFNTGVKNDNSKHNDGREAGTVRS